ncbi:MAG TPA: CAP domain-containing protein [Planctomicrobium sp.]|nr:CAP domain-containing protein [Planctomicrobium sp.]
MPPGPPTVTITKAQTGEYRPRFKPNRNEVTDKIIQQTNSFREKEKLKPVVRDDILQKSAQDFADFMAKTGKYGHHADDQTPGDRVKSHGYEICYIAENIAFQFRSNGFTTASLTKTFFEGWKDSPPHRENMLQPSVTQTGVAISQSEETGAYFAVQLFGRPVSQAIHIQINNPLESEISYQLNEETYLLPPRYTRSHMLCVPATLHLRKNGKVVSSLEVESKTLYTAQIEKGEIDWIKSPLPSETSP